MKTVHFVRHAKSSWSDTSLKDHDRPLNGRGKRDAPYMAARLVRTGTLPEGILTSTAKRARATAKAFREAFGLGKEDVIRRPDLYHAMPTSIEEELRTLPDAWSTVLVFGHNPGYTYLANQLQHEAAIDNVPTCGIVTAELDVVSWRKFSLRDARRTAFLYPKQEV